VVRTPAVAAVAVVALAAACGGGQRPRPYPAPDAKTAVDWVAGLRDRAASLNAETRTDFRLEKDRVNLTVLMLAAWGGKLRFQAQDPNSSMAADLASDGKRYCFIDVHQNCAECGTATPENVARMIRIPLDPDDVVAVLLGGAPVLAGTNAAVAWDADAGDEVLTLSGPAATETIRLDGANHRWDVLEAEVKSADGQLLWRLRHKDFHDVTTTDGKPLRLPGASLFEQGGDSVRIQWHDQKVGESLNDSKFRITTPPGLPACPH
jgi:hypothetical protein